MRTKLWRTITAYLPGGIPREITTPGTPLPQSAIALPQAQRSSYDNLCGDGPVEPPLTFRFVVQEEGVDFPFYSRGVDPTARQRRCIRSTSRYLIADSIPFPIFEGNAVDPSPLFFSMGDDTPGGWRVRRTKAAHAARNAFAPTQNLPPLNAGTYSDLLCRMLSEIQRHLLEPTIDGGVTWQLWTQDEVLDIVRRRLANFLESTGLIRTRVSVNVPAGSTSILLPSTSMQVRRVTWRSPMSPMVPVDEWAIGAASPTWESDTGTPYLYLQNSPLEIRPYPIPDVDGVVDLTLVLVPDRLVGCVPIPIPAIFVPFLKWGIIADLLRKEGEANDPERAKYAEGRFQEGIELARLLLGTEV